MREFFKIGNAGHEVFLSGRQGRLRLHLGSEVFSISASDRKITVDGIEHDVVVALSENRLLVHHEGEVYEIQYVPAVTRFADGHAQADSDHLVAPMPGAVVACAVKAGDDVELGAPLLVIESMKLETPFKAWRAGKIAAIHVGVGQNFERDKVLLSMEPA